MCRNCPLDLKEAISSLIFASPRCSDLPELLQIRQLFAAKYGKEFAAAAAELRPDCGVNRRVGIFLEFSFYIVFNAFDCTLVEVEISTKKVSFTAQ